MTGSIERVVVQLDAASENSAAIDTAARLAARARAPLHGVFVEDEELLSLAGLPFAHQVTLAAGAERFTTQQAELHLRAASVAAGRELAAAGKRHRVKHSFAVVRGGSAAALSFASERDLVVAGGVTRPVAGQFRTAVRWWSAMDSAPGPFLLVRHAWSASGGAVVMLLRERGTAAARLAEAAAGIAHATDSALIVIAPSAVAGAKGFQKWLVDRLGGLPLRPTVEIAPEEPAALRRRIVELECHLLAIEAGVAEGGGPDRLRRFVERFACDILIAR